MNEQHSAGSSNAMVDGEHFITAWVSLDRLPGGMMMCNGKPFGPVPATTGCSITTSPSMVEEWRVQGKPALEIQLRAAAETCARHDIRNCPDCRTDIFWCQTHGPKSPPSVDCP